MSITRETRLYVFLKSIGLLNESESVVQMRRFQHGKNGFDLDLLLDPANAAKEVKRFTGLSYEEKSDQNSHYWIFNLPGYGKFYFERFQKRKNFMVIYNDPTGVEFNFP